jgi:hypothetical protein
VRSDGRAIETLGKATSTAIIARSRSHRSSSAGVLIYRAMCCAARRAARTNVPY